jgi:hypothetical protein
VAKTSFIDDSEYRSFWGRTGGRQRGDGGAASAVETGGWWAGLEGQRMGGPKDEQQRCQSTKRRMTFAEEEGRGGGRLKMARPPYHVTRRAIGGAERVDHRAQLWGGEGTAGRQQWRWAVSVLGGFRSSWRPHLSDGHRRDFLRLWVAAWRND